jgi:hypothetical protein
METAVMIARTAWPPLSGPSAYDRLAARRPGSGMPLSFWHDAGLEYTRRQSSIRPRAPEPYPMLKPSEFLILTVVASLFLLVTIVNVGVSRSIRAAQTQFAEQQQFIAQTAPLETLNRELIRALAELSARNKDEALRNLLAANGVTFSFDPAPAAPAKK